MRVIRLTLLTVSTHSRPKAAGIEFSSSFSPIGGFNTQPPEGGWVFGRAGGRNCQCFNTQPPEGGWPSVTVFAFDNNRFQHTAARRRLVGISLFIRPAHYVFQHTAARRRLVYLSVLLCKRACSFNTQPPEGGWTCYTDQATKIKVSTHSRPKAAGQSKGIIMVDAQNVSTHSRPKAAGAVSVRAVTCRCRFNTQPPEGGWGDHEPNHQY